ncbi:hypothetical protein FRC09_005676 [Ceratobasidium sp. 395]|nr:hypothetical protein FRC09_005676 [Ceratobasidium sp. 395]
MVDSGATSVFINQKIVKEFNIPTQKISKPRKLRVIDGREIEGGLVDTTCSIELKIFDHTEVIDCFVVNVGNHDIVLGTSWLKRHNPHIDWEHKILAFSSKYCTDNCLDASLRIQFNRAPEGEVATTEELPADYEDFKVVFAEEETTPLPPHRPYDISIDLKPDARPRHGPIYSVGVKEDKEMRETIERQLAHGLIRPSKSPMASPVIFVKKKNGKLRMCIDYRRLNDMTVKNVYPLPQTNNLIEKLCGAAIFTKLDLKWGYNLVRIKEGDEWKTAFKTKYGLFEYLVMPFGLTNAPATFQHFMNDILRDILDIFVIVYLDNILIFSKSKELHKEHVKEVLSRLKKHGLYCNLEKCFFDVEEIDYLGLIVSPEGVKVDQEKVTKAIEWGTPFLVKTLQEFLGFVNFYRKFVPNYSRVAAPLFQLLSKEQPWVWEKEQEEAFKALRSALRSAPLLIQPDPEKQFFVECDASDFATGAVLSQIGPDNKLHPIAFMSKSNNPAERNYDIYNKELMAIVKSFKEWRHLLVGTDLPIQVISDHKNLEYFKTTKSLTGRLARWANFLADFNYQILYKPGSQNCRADILSRKEEHRPKEGGESQALLHPDLFIAAISTDSDIDERIRDAILEDERLSKIIKALQDNNKVEHWEWKDGLLKVATILPQRVPPGLLNPIDLPNRPWEEITYDLIVQLPESEGFDAIFTVVDRLSKMVHFIPTTSNATAVDIANLFVNYVWKLHGLPNKTISDRGPNFNSKFLKQLYARLNIQPHFSTAYRPQTDGQSERANQMVEGYLRHYISHRQDDWVALLPLAEFAYNNGVNSSTGKSPFYACYSFHPRFAVGDNSIGDVPAADDRANWLQSNYDELKAALDLSNEKIKEFYDRKHRAPEDIKVGAKVWLSSKDITTNRPSKKLAAKWLGPFKVLKKVGTHAFKLELPKTMKVHPVFHISKVALKKDDPFGREPAPLPPVVTPEGEEEYEVKKILDSDYDNKKKVLYHVSWKGWGPQDNTREPYENMKNALAKLRDFHKRHPKAARDHRV